MNQQRQKSGKKFYSQYNQNKRIPKDQPNQQSERHPGENYGTLGRETKDKTSKVHSTTHVDQCNRIEDTERTSCNYGQLILDKEAKIHTGEKIASLTKGVRKTGYPNVED